MRNSLGSMYQQALQTVLVGYLKPFLRNAFQYPIV